MQWYLEAFNRYFDFAGRSSRRAYWMFILVNILVTIGLNIIGYFIGGIATSIGGIYSIAALIPGGSVAVRRLHDTGRSGWWMLINLIPLIGMIVIIVFLAQEGSSEDNEFGASTKRLSNS